MPASWVTPWLRLPAWTSARKELEQRLRLLPAETLAAHSHEVPEPPPPPGAPLHLVVRGLVYVLVVLVLLPRLLARPSRRPSSPVLLAPVDELVEFSVPWLPARLFRPEEAVEPRAVLVLVGGVLLLQPVFRVTVRLFLLLAQVRALPELRMREFLKDPFRPPGPPPLRFPLLLTVLFRLLRVVQSVEEEVLPWREQP